MLKTETFTLTLEGAEEREIITEALHDHYKLMTLQSRGEVSPRSAKIAQVFIALSGGLAPHEYEKVNGLRLELRSNVENNDKS